MDEQCKYYKQYYDYVINKVVPNDSNLRKVFDILSDVLNRRGLKQQFEGIDAFTQEDIIDNWISILQS